MKSFYEAHREFKKRLGLDNKRMAEIAHKAKETLINQNGISDKDHNVFMLGFIAGYKDAMDAVRKDEAIAFGKWITENAFEPTGINKWEQCYTKAGDETTYSTKQLYELFKKEK